MARGRKTGGRKKGTPNRVTATKNILYQYTPKEVAAAFERARRRNGRKPKKLLPIIDHLCDLAYKDTTTAFALIKKIQADKRTKEERVAPTDTEWATETPSSICNSMDDLTAGKPET